MVRPARPLALTLLLCSSALCSALASPAQDLFDQVRVFLTQGYGGLSTVDRSGLARDYQRQLDQACAPDPDRCPLDRAYDVLEREVDALGDRHTFFERPEDFQDFAQREAGGSRLQYGVRLGQLDGETRLILEVVPGSAADRAGLRRGDTLLTLNGAPYSYAQFSASRESGHEISLGVSRAGQPLSVKLTPGVSSTRELPRLSWQGTVAVLRIPTFLAGGGVGQRVHDLVGQARAQGASGLVVDLRDNGGGDLAECDLAVSAFVPSFTRLGQGLLDSSRTVVSGGLRREDGRAEESVTSPQLWEGPLTVAVNDASGSCSEFFAYEVQYAGRGLVVGEPTAGVGNSATQVFPLLGGAGLQLTVTHYVKPDGTPYPERVTPQVAGKDDYARLAQGQDVLLGQAVTALKDAPSLAASSSRPRAQRGN